MIRLVIAYSTTGGNTRETAHLVAEGAEAEGAEVDLYDVYGLDASILLEADAILLGEPTWGDGEHHADFQKFDTGMAELLEPERKLANVPAAAFVGCDRAYRDFGGALVRIENRLIACGAEVIQRGLKIELQHTSSSRAFTRRWAANFVKRVRGQLPAEPVTPRLTRDEVDVIMGVSESEREHRRKQGLH